MSDIQQSTAEILALNADLERRLRQCAEQLEVANADLETLAYSVGHDMKAPLWAISGFGEILAADHRASLNPEGQKYLDLILQSTAKMTRLIDDFLVYARLGRKSVHLEPLDLREILTQSAADFSDRIRDSGAQIVLPANMPALVSDRALLSQIFSNLLDNALKFSRKDTPPRIEFSAREEPGQYVACVADNGIGIPEKYREQIFSIFKRLHTEKEYPGTGVGLAVVRKATQLLGGSVWAEGNAEGSTFCVKLPRLS